MNVRLKMYSVFIFCCFFLLFFFVESTQNQNGTMSKLLMAIINGTGLEEMEETDLRQLEKELPQAARRVTVKNKKRKEKEKTKKILQKKERGKEREKRPQ